MLTKLLAIAFASLCLVFFGASAMDEQIGLHQPNTIVYDPAVLALNKMELVEGDTSLQSAFNKLIRQAEEALLQPPVSVMEKEEFPPSGDRHDYMSIALYAWPNPDSEDGLPYIRRDGEISPMAYSIPDKRNKGLMMRVVETLSLAYFYSGDERYADHAALMLDTWFIDDSTMMNPNLEYAQSWPGISDGRYYGIIDTANFSMLPDYVALLAGSEHWTDTHEQGMMKWCEAYLNWLTTSIFGKAEGATKNNHGSWYDCQVVALALYCGQPDVAASVLTKAQTKRIAAHISPDGSQKHELKRTKSWDYSVYNLRALFGLAVIGRHIGVDLWEYESDDGSSLIGALNYLLQYADREEDWPHNQIYEIKPASLRELLLIADSLSDDKKYYEAVIELDIAPSKGDRRRLVYRCAAQ